MQQLGSGEWGVKTTLLGNDWYRAYSIYPWYFFWSSIIYEMGIRFLTSISMNHGTDDKKLWAWGALTLADMIGSGDSRTWYDTMDVSTFRSGFSGVWKVEPSIPISNDILPEFPKCQWSLRHRHAWGEVWQNPICPSAQLSHLPSLGTAVKRSFGLRGKAKMIRVQQALETTRYYPPAI